MAVLGVDIGGTKIAAGEVDADASVRSTNELPTQADQGFIASLSQVYKSIEQTLHRRIEAIGISAPGPLNARTGMVLNPPALPGWRNIPIAELIQARFQIPCRLENDANAAGLAEALFGAGRRYGNVLYVSIGAGIGTGIILDGKIYHGKNGVAAEGGHITIDYTSSVRCACGLRGCIETAASVPAIEKRAAELAADFRDSVFPEPITYETLSSAALAGDALAVTILDETAEKLSVWLGGLLSLLDPEIVVVGGSAATSESLLTRLQRLTPLHTVNQNAASTPIVPAQLSRDVGILGAAAVVLQD
jgi:glucokinase